MHLEASASLHYVPLSLRERYQLHEPATSTDLTPPSADIDWEPDYAKYKNRERRRLQTEFLVQDVPEGWPAEIRSPLAWSTDTFGQSEEYIYALNNEEKEEIHVALASFKALKLEPQEADPETFPLPSLGSTLRDLSLELHNGRGFFIIRGINPTEFAGEDSSLIFLGISSHIANQRGRQTQDGSMLIHLMDASDKTAKKDKIQSVYTNVAQPFHNDVFCDVLALQTRSRAAEGGRSLIASVSTIYNELARTRPDLIHTLAANDWTFDTFGRSPLYHQRPLLFHHANNLLMSFSRRVLTGSPQSPRTPNIPPVTEAQAEALDVVHFLALKHSISTELQPGDLRYINNHAILHCRDSFRDSGATKRHLVRLWLRDEELRWDIPSGLRLASERVFGGSSGDEDGEERWDLDPVLDEKILLNPKSTCGHG